MMVSQTQLSCRGQKLKGTSCRGTAMPRAFAARSSAARQCNEASTETRPQQTAAQLALSTALSFTLLASAAEARPAGVNRPELLPSQPTPIIDVAGFLTPSEERLVREEVTALEEDTGYKLRVLAQSYPDTPGLAVREFWNVDDSTIVFVADPSFGDILNFNVGAAIDLEVPRSFWSRLAGKFGNKFFWQEKGEAASILNAVSAIDSCLREPPGRLKCASVQDEIAL